MIGKNCFPYVPDFSIINLHRLKHIEIGDGSFASKCERVTTASYGTFEIRNCSRLEMIQMDRCAFTQYARLAISELPSLRSLTIGNQFDSYSFYRAPAFTLTGNGNDDNGGDDGGDDDDGDNDDVLMDIDLPALEELSLGTMAFAKVQTILLNSMSSSISPLFSFTLR